MRQGIPDRARLFTLFGGIAGLCVLAGSPPATAQAPSAPAVQQSQFDPSDIYLQGYLSVSSAEQLESSGDFIGALDKLERADQMFETIRRYHPAWKPEMVATRGGKTRETIARVRPKAEEQRQKNRNTVAELEGGVRKAGEEIRPDPQAPPEAPGILDADPQLSRRLGEADAEVQRLRQELARSANRADPSLAARLLAAENRARALRAKATAVPLEGGMTALNRRIETLEQERNAMALALKQSRDAHEKANSRIAQLQQELNDARQKRADLERDLQTEREVSNDVVAGLRSQLDALEKEVGEKDRQLAKANTTIQGLVAELQQSRDTFAELRKEHDGLLRERDHMAALLKLNEGDRIQQLIEQNMGLAKDLREANERVERLNRESNADKDAITDALRDLAIAKSQINRLHQEKREQDARLAELETRLKNEESALASGKTGADPAEVAMLRDIIKRQLVVQERRRQARDLLVDAAKDLGTKDEQLAKAIELFDAQEIRLTPDEMKLVADREVDGEFIAPSARDRATVGKATAELYRDIEVFERTAEKSFLSGRLMPTRELYEMILDQHPGHTPSLCRLGVVHLKLGETTEAAEAFIRATELDDTNPYAFRMLGFCRMKAGDLSRAEEAARRAVGIAPNDGVARMLLGTLCYRLGRIPEAASEFKAAISANPLPSEPYFNLALISLREGRADEARTFYQQALERGALPDPRLEEKLAAP